MKSGFFQISAVLAARETLFVALDAHFDALRGAHNEKIKEGSRRKQNVKRYIEVLEIPDPNSFL